MLKSLSLASARLGSLLGSPGVLLLNLPVVGRLVAFFIFTNSLFDRQRERLNRPVGGVSHRSTPR